MTNILVLCRNKAAIQNELDSLFEYSRLFSLAPLSKAIAFNTPNGLKCCKIEKDYPAVFINKALYTMAGYKSMVEMQTATNGKLSKLIYSADLEKVKKAMVCHTEGDIYIVNYRLLRKNDSPIWVIERGQYFVSPDKELIGQMAKFCTILLR